MSHQRKQRLELTMGGKSYPLLFNFSMLDFLEETISIQQLEDLGTKRPWKIFGYIALAALRAGAKFENKPDKFDLAAVEGWFEGLDPADAGEVMDCYKALMGFTSQALIGGGAGANPPIPTGTGS